MVNYNNGKVYMIQPIMEHEEGEIYIGSTTKQYLSQRMDNHRRRYKFWKNGKGTKFMCFDLFDKYGIENCQILLIENVHANSKDELVSREGYYIRNMKCINKNIAGRTEIEYRKDNRDKLILYSCEYYKNNKDKVKLYHSEYRKSNQAMIKKKRSKKIFCECGIYYTNSHKSRHLKTFKHQSTMELIDKINHIINNFRYCYHLHQI
jgi:predicted GIY-YIG superfamily endonuclease